MVQEEAKSETPKKQQQAQQHHQGGLFPFNVGQFFSEVASAGQAALKEAQEKHIEERMRQQKQQQQQQQQQQHRKPPVAGTAPKTKQSIASQSVEGVETKPRSQQPPSIRKKLLPQQSPTPMRTVVEMPKDVIDQPIVNLNSDENDWELLSADERASNTSSTSQVFVVRAGSVRSITSVEQENSSHATTLSVPFKIQRTNSSSTLDSQDNVIGPSGKGILGVDYVEHVVLPTDTLQGICIAYKVSASHLRRANHFTGALHSAPKKLLIPLSKQALRTGFIRVQDTDTKEYKLHYFQAEYPDINATEARAYLELADWDLQEALRSVKEDREWEEGDDTVDGESNDYESTTEANSNEDEFGHKSSRYRTLKSGQIGIKATFSRAGQTILNLKGTGHSPFHKGSSRSGSGSGRADKSKVEKVVIHAKPPAIATKSVLPEDLYNAAPQHNAYGLELQELPRRDDSTQQII
jgi:LysM repeat protein